MQNYLFVHPMDGLGLEINKGLRICAVVCQLQCWADCMKGEKWKKKTPENKLDKFNHYFWVTLNE